MAKTQQDTRVADWLNCEPNSVTKGTMYQKEIYGDIDQVKANLEQFDIGFQGPPMIGTWVVK
ncbi:unnamed protein product [Fusarium graminearum]|uniref:Uncharacterized protein n=1 Tax=Gibberella zeae TaxID=5518 RepID=A0A4E9EHI7_GIBZA|nr:unnamed protein product [Fusarium graminearum]CAG1972759.1 unnamed protein product [Fusarium graminearum]